LKAPSIDRIDDYKGYTEENIQLMSWAENNAKGHADQKSGKNNKQSKAVLQFSLDGKLVGEYYSASQAYRDTAVSQGNISNCCRGKYKSAGGYIWAYK
jgi:hypothetical protein